MSIFDTINPATGLEIDTYQTLNASELDSILKHAQTRFATWEQVSWQEKKDHARQIADTLLSKQQESASLISTEMGKPIVQSQAEVDKCARLCRHYADHAEDYLKPREIRCHSDRILVCYRPLGVILGIMPWNFPFWQVFRFAIPNIMAGNVVLVKHARNVAGSAQLIEHIMLQAGLPEHVYTNIFVDHEQSVKLIADSRIKGISLTGSERAGQAIGEVSGRHLKPTVFELGGSDPYLVLQDADVAQAARLCVKSRMINSGQSCIAAKRFIVEQKVVDEFLHEIQEFLQSLAVGDPLRIDTDIGPLARDDLRQKLYEQVQHSQSMGSELLLGGKISAGEGCFFEPTLLYQAQPEAPVYKDEIFGPVCTVLRVRDEKEGIRIANDSRFGLGAAIFSRNLDRAREIATYEINAGTVAINDFVRSRPEVPFGGISASGYGRELSKEGIREFCNIKAIALGNS